MIPDPDQGSCCACYAVVARTCLVLCLFHFVFLSLCSVRDYLCLFSFGMQLRLVVFMLCSCNFMLVRSMVVSPWLRLFSLDVPCACLQSVCVVCCALKDYYVYGHAISVGFNVCMFVSIRGLGVLTRVCPQHNEARDFSD